MAGMSEDYIQLPPDSVGKRVRALRRTVGGVDVYERLVALAEAVTGEPFPKWYPTYSAAIAGSAVAANKHHLVIFNGSTSILRILKIFLFPELTAAVTGYIMGYRLWRTTSAGAGGTAITVNKMDTTDPNLPAGVTIWTNPTTAPTLSTLISVASVNPEETGAAGFPSILYQWMPWEKPLTLRQNQGITVQQYATAGVGLLNVLAVFQVI